MRKTIRAQTRYLRGELLKPGDVIVSRGHDKDSDLIAWSTFGRFSHAAIYVADYCVFESIDDGVGFSPLTLTKVGHAPAVQQRVRLLDVSSYRDIQVWRHPVLEQKCQSAAGQRGVSDALAEILIPVNGLEYPDLTALARASPAPYWVALPLVWLTAKMRRESRVRLPGMFCSQLVASALKDLGAEPLKKIVDATKISPNHLVRPRKTALKRLADIIVDDKFECEADQNDQHYLQDFKQSQQTLLNLVDKGRTQNFKLSIAGLNKKWENIARLYRTL
jgi:hypothetical protein